MELTKRERTLLKALSTRNGRRRSGCCRCEGVRAVRELLDTFPQLVRFTVATERGLAALPGDPPEVLYLVSEKEFEEFSATVNSQGIITVAAIVLWVLGAKKLKKSEAYTAYMTAKAEYKASKKK